MRKRVLALGLALCLALSGCSAMLERSYTVSSPHVDKPSTAEDPSVLRAENYRELVSAVLYLVSQHAETGTIQLLDYPGNVDTALTAACLEVATEDPLGAYCVDYIKHSSVRVVSYDQATIDIRYRRTADQVSSMVKVTGTSAIRTELREALRSYSPEVVLRVAYFSDDAASMAQLVRRAYYDSPAVAHGMPDVDISLYPDSGRERVVEILLSYPGSVDTLKARSSALIEKAASTADAFRSLPPSVAARRLAQTLRATVRYDPDGLPTPYAALIGGAANDEGMALAYTLLCQQANLTCEVVEGVLLLPAEEPPTDEEAPDGDDAPADGEEEPGQPEEAAPVQVPRFWISLSLPGEAAVYLDPTVDSRFLSARDMVERGYRWPGSPEPIVVPQETPEPAGEGPEDGSADTGAGTQEAGEGQN